MDENNNLGNTTFQYLGESYYSKVRHVLEFFRNHPRVIVIEYSKMANPYHIIEYLAGTLDMESHKKLRDRFIVGFLFWTGARVNEMLLTRKHDIDLITRLYNVPTLKQRRRVAYRPIPLSHVPSPELKLWSHYLDDVDVEENILSVSDRQVERIVKKLLGPEYYPHMLRHGLGLFLYEYTKDIRVVAQVLRHTNVANTMIYSRLSIDALHQKLDLSS